MRREDAEALRLSTKQDWERLLRSQWPLYMERLGVMEAQDVRWVAAFHVNQRNNLHCHVFTWDASGRFNELLPKRAMTQANEALQAHVLRPQQEELNLRRTQARDELAAAMRSGALGDGLRERVLDALPESGSLKYASLAKRQPEAAKAVADATRERVTQDGRMSALHAEYLAAVRENTESKGLSPQARDAYIDAAMADLDCRLANALIANARRGGAPVQKPAQRQAQKQAAGVNADYLPPSERRRTQAMAEEAGSCLRPGERRALRRGLSAAAKGERLDGESAQALSKLPTFKAAIPKGQSLPAAAQSAASSAAQGIANAMAQAAGGGRSDMGDEAGQGALQALARALRALLRRMAQAPKQAAPALSASPKLKG